jgi:prophage tail gpP-like protein
MPGPSPDVPMIRAGNGQCTLWQRFRFTRSIEHLPSIVFFEASERIQAFNEAVLAPFTACTVSIGADKILTGYCDVVEPRVEKRNHEISMAPAAGRSPPARSAARPS